jgi:hypothetical protein
MASQQLRHDAARAAATALLDVARNILLNSEHKLFHDECYKIVRAALESYDIMREREAARLCTTPSKN